MLLSLSPDFSDFAEKFRNNIPELMMRDPKNELEGII